MGTKNYSYQYETSPRKIKPEYNKTKNKQDKENLQVKKGNKKKIQKNTVLSKKDIRKKTQKNKAIFKARFCIFYKAVLIFGLFFLILFRNSQISESFSKIQALKSEITTIQKENDQLEISIQNSLNSNNIEKAAKELLGMQKLTNKQTVYINLPKKDYVEHRAEEVELEENKGFFKNIFEKIANIF